MNKELYFPSLDKNGIKITLKISVVKNDFDEIKIKNKKLKKYEYQNYCLESVIEDVFDISRFQFSVQSDLNKFRNLLNERYKDLENEELKTKLKTFLENFWKKYKGSDATEINGTINRECRQFEFQTNQNIY